jgi:F-box/leucine-rich repeat protein 10/11
MAQEKRTSTRPRTTVDYAGLNEGVLRMPGESREHHYVESFKSGTVNLTPETFPRIPGNEITADFFEKCHSFSEPIVVPKSLNPRPSFPGTISGEQIGSDDDHVYAPDDGQDDMDMVIPQELTVRRVSELYGPKNIIPVIDVKAQESSKGWTVEKWADYYENPDGEPIRNVISLECSTTPLCRLIRRPKVVRDLDLQDSVWPDTELRRSVGFYVLMSVADCFTDFHIDFGGSSVYYHIIKGKKVFFFIPPTPSNLQKYQEWNDMPSQTWTWLPDITKTKECYRVDLYPGDTMLIPAGWIHAVWTPDHSLVIGGNFLTRLHYGTQFRVAEIEKANKTPITFRYPKFQKVMWYAVLQYLERDPLPADVREMFLDGNQFTRARPVWAEFDKFGENSDAGPENFNARYYPKSEVDGFPEMVNYIFRTVMIYLDRLENISVKVRKAVTDSIPKSNQEPLDIARDFAMWVAWKRGNEDVPEWAHPGAVLPNKAEEPTDKKLTDAQMKKLQRTSAISAPERQSARLKSVAETVMQQQEQLALASTPKTSSLGPRRTACDSCRRRKMRCKHVENFPAHSSPIIFTSPLESSPQSTFVGVVIPDASAPPAASFPPPFQVDPVAPMANGIELQGFTPGPKQEVTDLKKGRTKACYECRRSKVRCIHQHYLRSLNMYSVDASTTSSARLIPSNNVSRLFLEVLRSANKVLARRCLSLRSR